MATKIKNLSRHSKRRRFAADVLGCCVPLLVFSCFLYGPRVLMLAAIASATAYVLDRILVPLHGPGYIPNSLNSICFSVLLTLLFPAGISIRVLVTAVVAAVLSKEVFGGDANYPFHPTAVGYVLAAVGWPEQVFRFPRIGILPLWDASSAAAATSAGSVLLNGGLPNISVLNLLLGNYAGPIGTGPILIILACAAFLTLRRDIDLSAVLAFLAGCAAMVWLLPQAGDLPDYSLPWQFVATRLNVLRYEMLSSALLFAAVFLVCEPATLPSSRSSRIVYGVVLGFMTMLFRYYGTYEISVCFAILIMNAISDWLDVFSERMLGLPVFRNWNTRRKPPVRTAPPARRPEAKRPRPAAAAARAKDAGETRVLTAETLRTAADAAPAETQTAARETSAAAQKGAAAAEQTAATALFTAQTETQAAQAAPDKDRTQAAQAAPGKDRTQAAQAAPHAAPEQRTAALPKLDSTLLQAVQNTQKAREQQTQNAQRRANRNEPGRRARRRAAAQAAQAAQAARQPMDTAYLHTIMIPRLKEVPPHDKPEQ